MSVCLSVCPSTLCSTAPKHPQAPPKHPPSVELNVSIKFQSKQAEKQAADSEWDCYSLFPSSSLSSNFDKLNFDILYCEILLTKAMDYVENCVRTIVTFCRLTCQHSSGGNHRRLPQKIAVDLDESQAGAVFYYRKNVFKNQLLSPGPITNSPLPFSWIIRL